MMTSLVAELNIVRVITYSKEKTRFKTGFGWVWTDPAQDPYF
jgi:hypothetical protein